MRSTVYEVSCLALLRLNSLRLMCIFYNDLVEIACSKPWYSKVTVGVGLHDHVVHCSGRLTSGRHQEPS